MDLTSNWFDIVRDAGLVSREILGKDQYVDVLPLRRSDKISDYMMREMQPFYVTAESK